MGLGEEEVEAGGGGGDGGGEEEGADDFLLWEEVGEEGHQEFLVWREGEEEGRRQGLWMEEEEVEELLGHLSSGEEEGVGRSYGGVVEEEGAHHEREAEVVLKGEGGETRSGLIVGV